MKGDISTLRKVCGYAKSVLFMAFFALAALAALMAALGAHSFFGGSADLVESILPMGPGAPDWERAALVAESVLVLGMGAAVAGILSRIMESVASEPSPFTLKNAGLMKAIALMFLPASAALFVLELLAGRGPAEAVFVLFGALLVSLVMYCLTIVFRYGAALQKESDETL